MARLIGAVASLITQRRVKQDHAEQSGVILPHFPALPARPSAQFRSAFPACACSCSRCGSTHPRANAICLPTELHRLIAPRNQVHLDPAFVIVPHRLVAKIVQVEIGAGLPVQPPQKIQVERRGNTCGIVIGRQQYLRAFPQIGPQQEPRIRPKRLPGRRQECGRRRRIQIADRRAGKEPHPRTPSGGRRSGCMKSATIGTTVRSGMRLAQPLLHRVQGRCRNIDRHVGGERRLGPIQQNAGLGFVAAAEFHQGGIVKSVRHRSAGAIDCSNAVSVLVR